MYDLAPRLQCSRPEALGFLILLWDFTAEVSIEGSIGRWSDGSIARACDWNQDPEVFINALVASGWLDRDPTHRLLIHDWPDHCERWVHAKLAKIGKKFAQATSVDATAVASQEPTAEPSPPRDRTEPNRTTKEGIELLGSIPSLVGPTGDPESDRRVCAGRSRHRIPRHDRLHRPTLDDRLDGAPLRRLRSRTENPKKQVTHHRVPIDSGITIDRM